jgi:hypothetical protein
MDAQVKAALDKVKAASATLETWVKNAAALPIVAEALKTSPSLAKDEAALVADLAGAGQIIAAIELLDDVYTSLGGRPNQDLDNVGPGRSEMRDG